MEKREIRSVMRKLNGSLTVSERLKASAAIFSAVERLPEFLEADLDPLPPDILKLYDSTLWWTDRDPAGSAP